MHYAVPGEHTSSIAALNQTSSATATVAGIAALIWSRYPNWSAAQVRARIQQSGHYYPARDPRRGYGIINAYRAVGGFESLHLAAPLMAAPGETVSVSANPRGEGPFTYLWSNGATTPSTSLTVGTDFGVQHHVWVQVTDQVENLTRTRTETITVGYYYVPPNCDPNLDPLCPA